MLLLNLCKILELSGPSVPVGTCYVFSVWGRGQKKLLGYGLLQEISTQTHNMDRNAHMESSRLL